MSVAAHVPEVEDAVRELNLALRTHGGAVELVGVDDDMVTLRMVGLCAACLFKPITMEATIRPFIAERLGLQVQMTGARISAEAQERLARALAGSAGEGAR
jgi:Fe-S cluster biogenesis protein NfuA